MIKTLEEFLQLSRAVTDRYIEARGKWDLKSQWDKIKEEEEEFEHATDNLNELEEFWDNFFAKLTLLHLKGYHDYAVLESANSTLAKITGRSLRVLEEAKTHE